MGRVPLSTPAGVGAPGEVGQDVAAVVLHHIDLAIRGPLAVGPEGPDGGPGALEVADLGADHESAGLPLEEVLGCDAGRGVLDGLPLGLPGAGKTTLSKYLAKELNAVQVNADKVRRESNDWDFSLEGRRRQAKRMKELSDFHVLKGQDVVADFICPTNETRKDFDPDYIVWVDTIKKGRFEDTNKMFVTPNKYDVRVTEKNKEQWAKKIKQLILKE